MFNKIPVPKNVNMPIFDKLDTKPQARSAMYKAHYDLDMLKQLVGSFPIMSASNLPSNVMIGELKQRGYVVYAKRS